MLSDATTAACLPCTVLLTQVRDTVLRGPLLLDAAKVRALGYLDEVHYLEQDGGWIA